MIGRTYLERGQPVDPYEEEPDDYDDPDLYDGYDPGEDCGRWDQSAPGGMARQCRLAGTEFCDWECPHSRAAPRTEARRAETLGSACEGLIGFAEAPDPVRPFRGLRKIQGGGDA